MTLVHYDSLLHTGTCSLKFPFRCWDDKNVFNRFISILMLVFVALRWSRRQAVQRYPSIQSIHPQHIGMSVPNCSKPINTDLTRREEITQHHPSQILGNPGQLTGNPSQLSSNPGQLSSNPCQLSSNPVQIFGYFWILLAAFGNFWQLFGNFWQLFCIFLGTFGILWLLWATYG